MIATQDWCVILYTKCDMTELYESNWCVIDDILSMTHNNSKEIIYFEKTKVHHSVEKCLSISNNS